MTSSPNEAVSPVAHSAPRFRDLLSGSLLLLQLAVLIAAPVHLLRVGGDLPERIAVHFNAAGEPDRWARPGQLWVSVAMMVVLVLISYTIIAGFAWERWALPAGASSRHAELQRARRVILARFMQALALGASLVAGGLGLAVAEGMRTGHRLAPSWVVGSVAVFLSLLVLAIGIAAWKLRQVRRELEALGGSFTEAMHADGWIWGGAIYYAPADPALLVPKRGGFGQTFNFARPLAWIITGAFLLPLAGAMIALLRSGI